MAHPTQAIPFSPPPGLIPLIIDQITDPALSLRDIAAANGTTTEALSLFLSSPDIRQRLELLDSAVCTRVRQLASAQLDTVLLTLHTIQKNFHRATGCGRFGPQPVPTTTDPGAEPALLSNPRNPRSSVASPPSDSEISNFKFQILQHRIEETARKAGATIYRLTRLQPAHIQSHPRPITQTTAAPDPPTHAPAQPNPAPPSGRNPALAPNPNLPCTNSDSTTLTLPPVPSPQPSDLPAPSFPITPDSPLASIANLEAFLARLEAEEKAEAEAEATLAPQANPRSAPAQAHSAPANPAPASAASIPPATTTEANPPIPTALSRNKQKHPTPPPKWRGPTSPSRLADSAGSAPHGPWP